MLVAEAGLAGLAVKRKVNVAERTVTARILQSYQHLADMERR